MFSDDYIEEVLLRSQRAMLIISDRIQDKFLYLYSSIYNDLQYKQRDIYILFRSLSDTFPYKSSYSTYDALINVLVSKCQEVDAFNSTYNTINPNYANPDGGTVVVPATGTVLQTAVVYPGDGETSYTFSTLIGQQVLTVYRGTSTTLRAWSFAPTNEYAQFNPVTGEITVIYAFGDGESLWAEYKTV